MTKKQSERGSVKELAALFPGTRQVTVGDEVVTVHALTIVEIGALVEKIEPLILAYDEARAPIQLISRHTAEVVELAAAATDRSAEWLSRVDAGDFLRVGVAAIEANANFFVVVRDLMLGETGARLQKMFSGAGPTASPSSPPTASTQ